MDEFFAIALYQCFVAGEATGSVDFQVRYFEAESHDAVVALLSKEDPQSYKNGDGDTVEWVFLRVAAIEPFAQMQIKNLVGPASGDELIGFIDDPQRFLDPA